MAQPEDQIETLRFTANLANRQTSLMMSGDGQRLLIELEVFNLDAAIALVGMTKFAGKQFQVQVSQANANLTELDDETSKGTERKITRVGRRRPAE